MTTSADDRPAGPATPPRRDRARGQVLLGLLSVLGLAALDSTVVATAVPSIVEDLSGLSLFPWVFSVYALTSAVTVPAYGKLADLHGRKPLLIFGTVLFLIGSLLCGLAWDMVSLIAFRAVQGIGAGALLSLSMTVLGDLYAGVQRARVQTWVSAVFGTAGLAGPVVGGLIAEHTSWRWIFLMNLPVGVVALALVAGMVEEVRRQRHQFDAAGMLLLISGATLFLLGLLQGGVRWAWASGQSVGLFAAAGVLGAAFVAREHRAAEPIVPPWVFCNWFIAVACLIRGVAGAIVIGVSTFLPYFAQTVPGTSPVAAGFTLAALMIAWPLASAASGRLCLKIGFRNTAVLGAVSWLIGGLSLAVLPTTVPIAVIWACCAVLGVGTGLLLPATLIGVQEAVDWGRRGVATATLLFTQTVGGALGAACLGALVNSTLSARIAAAPESLAWRLPSSVDGVTAFLRDGSGGVQAQTYLRETLDLAVHRVFWGVTLLAVVGVVLTLTMPWQFRLPRSASGSGETEDRPTQRSAWSGKGLIRGLTNPASLRHV